MDRGAWQAMVHRVAKSRTQLKLFSTESKFLMLSDAQVLQLCPTFFDPMDYSPPGSSVSGILQARILEWVAISFSSEWK